MYVCVRERKQSVSGGCFVSAMFLSSKDGATNDLKRDVEW
jgi:hypothetical protein